jgi:hypothetical protein
MTIIIFMKASRRRNRPMASIAMDSANKPAAQTLTGRVTGASAAVIPAATMVTAATTVNIVDRVTAKKMATIHKPLRRYPIKRLLPVAVA